MTAEEYKYCRGCEHVGTLSGEHVCDYILDTGHRRGCPVGSGCDKHTKLKPTTERNQEEKK